MSLPLAASGPLCGTIMPILMGPFWAAVGGGATTKARVTRPSRTTANVLRIEGFSFSVLLQLTPEPLQLLEGRRRQRPALDGGDRRLEVRELGVAHQHGGEAGMREREADRGLHEAHRVALVHERAQPPGARH